MFACLYTDIFMVLCDVKEFEISWAYQCTALVPEFERQRQAGLLSLKASLSTRQIPGQPGIHSETLS